MIEEETDEQQIRGVEADYKTGRFARVRELARRGEKALISLIRDEIRAIDEDIVFLECGRALFCNYYNSLLEVYFEDGTFALFRRDLVLNVCLKDGTFALSKHNLVDEIVSGRRMRFSEMVGVVKTYGFKEREACVKE